MAHEYEVGLRKDQLDTPALMVDLDVMERNIATMAGFFKGKKVKLRPHVKLHKATPVLAHLQLAAGGIGVTCAKLAEAELVASAGIKDILIANQIVGARKTNRLANLAAHSQVMVAVDSPENVAELSHAAKARGVTIRILVEVNIGNDRCGVAPFGPTLKLVQTVLDSPGLRFTGLMGYDGHCTFKAAGSERDTEARRANQLLADTRRFVQENGIPVEIASGSGTITYKVASTIEGITEIQAGSYLLMDTATREKGAQEFQCALTLAATVISRPSWPGGENIAIIDLGRKQMDIALGLPEVKSPTGATVFSTPQEHARLRLEGESRALRVGDRVELWVRDANGTINQHGKLYAMRGDVVEAVWDVPGRGEAT
jgi:D-serine deaminase-like pyridoxal phosphate-dependent protein